MLVRRLVLDNFRNIRSHEIDTCAKQIILKGENGQGKTNLLEAVYILCYGSSFRTQNLREAVTYGTSFFRLESSFTDAQGLERKTEVTFEDAKKLANQVVDDANSKASTIVKNADEKALKIVSDAETRSSEMKTASENMKAVVLAEVEELTNVTLTVSSGGAGGIFY